MRFWDAAIIKDGTPEYKMEENKQIYTQIITKITTSKEGIYLGEYYELDNPVGIITVEATPISIENNCIKYVGKFKLDYKKNEEITFDEDLDELHLTVDTFTLHMTDRWDQMRCWKIILNPGENQIILDLEIGYYASLLKADADAKVMLKLRE